MTGKYTSLIGLMSGVRDGLEFISLYLRACEMYQALLTRSPLTTKAVGGNGPKVKLREAAESHTWSPTMVTKQELLIAYKNSTAPLKAYQQLLKQVMNLLNKMKLSKPNQILILLLLIAFLYLQNSGQSRSWRHIHSSELLFSAST